MRILFLCIIFSILSLTLFGQEFKKVFLGKDALNYKGLILKYDQNSNDETDYSFYIDPPNELFQKPVYKPTNLNSYLNFKTDKSALTNRLFFVKNVSGLDQKIFNEGKYVFELEDLGNKEIIYYLYDCQLESDFPFLVKGFSYTTNYVKQYLVRKVDEFTNEISISTPLESNTSIFITKNIKKNIAFYYLNLSTIGRTLTYGGKGVKILFNDGTKWEKPYEKIYVNTTNGNGWQYSAFISLNQTDLNLFSNKVIKKFRLYIYDNYYLGDTEKFVYYFKAIKTMK